MDWMTLLQEIFEVCLIPLLGVLTTYLVKYINVKQKAITADTDNELTNKYVNMLADTITKCVIATNQTYVDSLKNKQAFTKEAQQEAYQKTLDAVMSILSDDAKSYLTSTFGDLETYIEKQIEAAVSENKATETTENK